MVQSIESALYPFVVKFNEYLSNYILFFLLISVGVWYTIKTRFVQVRCFKEGLHNAFGGISLSGKKNKNRMTSFQTFMTAIAAQVGTGNLVGAAAAILVGGPGSIFWMWVIAFFGMATSYAEANLAVRTRITGGRGNIKGGPVYYIRVAFKGRLGKALATFFAIAITLALGFMGCMVLSNSISYSMQTAFGVPAWNIGLALIIICGIIFAGGLHRLVSITEKLVPIMATIFLLGAFYVLIVRYNYIFETFTMIFKYAFTPQAIIGGGFWYAITTVISQGAKRGLFSNEAGMGSTPHIHVLTNIKDPHKQGTIAMMGVFVDTFVILTLNALVIISTLYTSDGPLANGYTGSVTNMLNKTNIVQEAFGSIFGSNFVAFFIALCLFFFAFSSILCWNLYGKTNTIYLFRKKNTKKAVIIYTIIALGFIMMGSIISSDFVWELTDMFNNLMVIPNVLALFALTNIVVNKAKKRLDNEI